MYHFSLRRQVAAINKLTDGGMFFWDYGNAFLLEASRAGECGHHGHWLKLLPLVIYVFPMFFRFFLFHQSWFFPFLFFLICIGADVNKESAPPGVFRYPSYVQDIMGYDSWWIIINTKDYSQNLQNCNVIGNSSSLVACKRDPSKTQFSSQFS